ncbi:hypothetical protein QTP88_005511 [Uroleucon formosanum]
MTFLVVVRCVRPLQLQLRPGGVALPTVILRRTVQISSVPAAIPLPTRISYSFGQSAQGRGVCAGTAQVSRSSPPVRATHVSHRRERAIERLGGGGRLWRDCVRRRRSCA